MRGNLYKQSLLNGICPKRRKTKIQASLIRNMKEISPCYQKKSSKRRKANN